jgi:hypothetical protein
MGEKALTRLGDVGTGVAVLLPHGRRRHILTYLGAMAVMTVADLGLSYLTCSRHFHLSSLFQQTGSCGLYEGRQPVFVFYRWSKSCQPLVRMDLVSHEANHEAPELLDHITLRFT